MVDSPEYACQLVFVTKLVAVLNARSGGTLLASKCCGIQWQVSLCALQQVGQQEAEDTEAQQRRSVVRPTLFDVFLDSGELVGEHLEPSQNRMQEGALTFEYLRHVGAERLVQISISPKNIAICKIPMLVISSSSELLRTQKRVDQVNEQAQRCNSGNDVVHVVLPKACRRPS